MLPQSIRAMARRGAVRCRPWSAKIPGRPSVDTEFDKKWRDMDEHQQDQVREEWSKLNELDWRTLTLDQKRACTMQPALITTSPTRVVYTIEYGPAEAKDPYEGYKIAAGTAVGVGAGLVLYKILRSFAAPPPHTMDPEWKRAEEERAIRDNINPIYNPDRRT